MKILFEDNHLLVVVKKVNMPVQKDSSNDLDVLTYLKDYLKKKYNKPGNVYLGLIHRLDRPVSGVMVFAKTSKAASRLSEQVRNHDFKKEYHAIIEGEIDEKGKFVDKLLKDKRTNMVSVDKNGKEAILNYELVTHKDKYSLVKIDLETGRAHQIRVQFASRNYPLYGDQRYNKNAIVKEQIALCATSLSFYHPITKELLTFNIDFPNNYPWFLFRK